PRSKGNHVLLATRSLWRNGALPAGCAGRAQARTQGAAIAALWPRPRTPPEVARRGPTPSSVSPEAPERGESETHGRAQPWGWLLADAWRGLRARRSRPGTRGRPRAWRG